MSDLKLYRINNNNAVELPAAASRLEKDLQRIVESNMEALFGVRLLASEFSTGPVHGGRMDSIGIDENGTPVIFEYKRNVSDSVINQGLFYLDWLMDHQGDFKVLGMDKLGKNAVDSIDLSSPRLVCVANDFTRYDEHAIRQMGRSIELVRYQIFDNELLALELVASTAVAASRSSAMLSATTPQPAPTAASSPTPAKHSAVHDHLAKSSQALRDIYEELRTEIEALGDDITMKMTKHYVAFRRIKNFASVEVYSQSNKLLVFVKVDPSSVALESGFSRDVTTIGHMGTGDLELTITDSTTLSRAMSLIQKSYEDN